MMEKKNIEDYISLFIGCEIDTPDGIRKMIAFNRYFELVYVETGPQEIAPSKAYHTYHVTDIKLILRPLSDMKEDEAKELVSMQSINNGGISEIGSVVIKNDWHDARYLLSKHFDLFGLIEANLAVDKTKITNHAK